MYPLSQIPQEVTPAALTSPITRSSSRCLITGNSSHLHLADTPGGDGPNTPSKRVAPGSPEESQASNKSFAPALPTAFNNIIPDPPDHSRQLE